MERFLVELMNHWNFLFIHFTVVTESVFVGVKSVWTFPLPRPKTILQPLPATNESETRIGTLKTRTVGSDVIEIKIAVKTAKAKTRIESVNGLAGVGLVTAVTKTSTSHLIFEK